MFDVVIPLFNKRAFVDATIASVLSQSFTHWRLFVIDDGSTDGSAERVGGYNDPRIQLIVQRNRGVGPARNTGIAQGSAAWIAFLDADDLWATDHLAELDAVRREFPQAVLVGTAFARFSGERFRPRTGARAVRRSARYFRECSRGMQPLFTSSGAVLRSAVDQLGGFKALPGNEDVELWARLALHGQIAVSTRETVGYRVDTGGITDQGLQAPDQFRTPACRDELSSAIPPLAEALPNVSDSRLRSDIIEYIDSRVGLSVVTAVRRGDIHRARELLNFYEGSPQGTARICAMIARLPLPLARFVAFAGVQLKAAVRRTLRLG